MSGQNKTHIPLLQRFSRGAHRHKKKVAKDGAHVVIIDGSSHPRRQNRHYERAISIRERYDRVGDTNNARKYTEELLQKVEDNDYDACQGLLEKHADVNVQDEETNSTALHIAAKNDFHDILELLLDKGADCNAQDRTEQSPLHLAATKGHSFICEKLFECNNLKVNIINKTNDTPLHHAAKEGRIDICSMILKHPDINVNVKNKRGMSPLHLAALENHYKVVQLLMDNGADWKLQDKNFHLPLHYAAQKGFPETCEVLMSNCIDADKEKQLKVALKDGKTPLMLAAKGGHHYCCAKLTNTNINAKDKEGNTALHYAAIGGFENTVAELLDMGSQPNTQNKMGNAPILEVSGKKRVGCLRILVEKGAKLGVTDKKNKTVLHYAAEKNAEECLKYLLSVPTIKALLDKKDDNDCAPLHAAIKREAVECAHILLENGASPVDSCIGGMTPLHLAADKGYTSICEILLARSEVQVSQENETKATPLHLAALRGSTDVCQMLLRKGARLTAVDKNGHTALHIASVKGHIGVVRFLCKKGVPQRAKDDTGSTALHHAAYAGSLECCKALVANAKATCCELDQNGHLPLDRAFEKKHDNVFKFLLTHLPYKETQEDRMLCLHKYMHTVLCENRVTAAEAIIDSSWWQAGFTGENGHHCQNFRMLVIHHPSLAMKVQDKCINCSDSDPCVTYDFRFFEDNYYIPTAIGKIAKSPFEEKDGALSQNARQFIKDGLEWKNNHPLSLMVSHNRHQLLHHCLTNAWLLHKWESYIYMIFLILLMLEVLFVTCLIIFMGIVDNWNHIQARCNFNREQFCSVSEVYKYTSRKQHNLSGNAVAENDTEGLEIFFGNATVIRFGECDGVPVKHGLWLALLITTFIELLLECNFIYTLKREYLSLGSVIRLLRAIFTIFVLVPGGSCEFHHYILEVWQWQFGIVALLVGCMHLINMLNQLPMLSVFMPITDSFLKSFFKVLFYIVMLVFMFAFIFHLLLRDQAAFITVPQAMVKTIVWMLGDLAYDDTFLSEEDNLLYPVMVNCLFVVFVTTIGGFIVNLVIAQPSEKLDDFREKAAIYRAVSRCRLFLRLDICFPFFWKYKTKGTFVEEVTKRNGYSILPRKLLMLDNKLEEVEPPNPFQVQLEEQNKQIATLLTLHMEQREELRDLKHLLNAITKTLLKEGDS